MKLLKRLAFLTLVPFVLVSCEHKQTVVEAKYPDQSPKVVKTYLVKGDEKKLIGEKVFYQGNKIQLEGTYKNEKRDGRWVYYHSNGKPWSEGYFTDGKANGRRVTYYDNGKMLYEGYYKEDKRVGIWKFYNEGGKLIREVNFSKNPEADTLSR